LLVDFCNTDLSFKWSHFYFYWVPPNPGAWGMGGIINLYIFKNFKFFFKFTINNCDKC
jgi:hypothetical protein